MTNKLVSMDIDQLRAWAAFMDKAMIVSLIAAIIALAALGITTWQSFRFSGAVRAHEQAAFDRYKGMESHSVQLAQDVAAARERAVALESEVSAARERAASLEREVSTAQGRTVALEQAVSAAREQAASLEQEAATARERAVAFEQAARDANERAARAAGTAAIETAQTPPVGAAEIQQRVADLAKLVKEAAARAPETPSPAVASLRKHAGTKAAVFVLDQAADAPAAGSTISAHLTDAGWAPQTWTWTGVAGIVGVVVLVREGSDPATNEAASTLVEALRSTGFDATKGDWPANWHRFRGGLDGPQTPGPTEAPIRIVIGAKPR